MKKTLFFENIKVALRSIRGQLLRTIITSLIIAIGITALVGILTAIDAIEDSLTGNFALLGANTFTIQNRSPNIRIGRSSGKRQVHPIITFAEAQRFQERMVEAEAVVSLSYRVSGSVKLKSQNQTTNPNIEVMAVDQNYLNTSGYELKEGRFITDNEVTSAASVAIIGPDVEQSLFGNSDPLGAFIQLRGTRLRVIGVLKSKGNSMGFGGDNIMWMPYTTARSSLGAAGQSVSVNVKVDESAALEDRIGEATALMRAVRKVRPSDESNFSIVKSDDLSRRLIDNLGKVSLAAVFIGAVTLMGAAIALMNIMLVSVTERTREIGIRKAIGAQSRYILFQFLMESVVICLLGGAAGVILGIGVGNITSQLIGGSFIIPWNWMMLAASLCLLVGLISGFYPAFKASRLDPIESLRYE